MNNLKKVILIRQSGVLPSDYAKPKEWREVVFLRILQKNIDTELWVSSFDHYTLAPRVKKDWELSAAVNLIKTPGYKSTTSIFRIFDAWIFSLKLGYQLLTFQDKKVTLVVALPTPESCFIASICSKIKGYRLVLDIRDNWPENFTKSGWIKRCFAFYVNKLNLVTFKLTDHAIWMSDGLKDNHQARGFAKNIASTTLPNPYSGKLLSDQLFLKYSLLFEKPVIAFFGTLNNQFELEQLADLLAENDLHSAFNFVIAGDGALLEDLQHLFVTFSNVYFLGQIPFEDTMYISQRSCGFFVFYRDTKVFENHITNKLREYAEFEKPIIHNLSSSQFSLDGEVFQLGCSIWEIKFEELLNDLLLDAGAKYFSLDQIQILKQETSFVKIESKLIEIVNG